MIAYATRTGTRRNLAVLRAAGWRLLVTPATLRAEGFPYALDNGAWTAHRTGRPFDADAFARAVEVMGAGADWVVLPDIVAGGLASLELSRAWLDRLRGVAPLVLPVQDGMTPADVRDLVPAVGLFVGGSTAWKLATLDTWGRFAAATGAYLHVARVNTRRRIRRCALAGAQSFDGTSVTRYADTLPELDAEMRQGVLGGPHVRW